MGFIFDLALTLVACSALMCLFRVIMGPTVSDRAVAFDTFATNLMVIVVLIAIRGRLPEIFDVVLVLAILGFVGTIAVAKYIKGGNIVG